MGVHGALRGWLCVGLLAMGGALWAGEAAEAPADAEALKKQVKEWREKDRAASAKLREIEAKIRKSPELAKLLEAEAQTSKAYDEKKKTDPANIAALKAESEARAALAKVVQAKLAENEKAQAVYKELGTMDDEEAAFDYQQALARFEITYRTSPVNRVLSKDAELATLRKALDEAERAYYRDKTKKDARDQARKAYDDARKAKLEALPEGKKLMDLIKSAAEGIANLRKARREATTKLYAIQRELERGDDADIKAAREKVAAAGKAVREAYDGEDLKAARKTRDEARKATNAKVSELMAADEAAATLAKEREALAKQIRDADRQIRKAAK